MKSPMMTEMEMTETTKKFLNLRVRCHRASSLATIVTAHDIMGGAISPREGRSGTRRSLDALWSDMTTSVINKLVRFVGKTNRCLELIVPEWESRESMTTQRGIPIQTTSNPNDLNASIHNAVLSTKMCKFNQKTMEYEWNTPAIFFLIRDIHGSLVTDFLLYTTPDSDSSLLEHPEHIEAHIRLQTLSLFSANYWGIGPDANLNRTYLDNLSEYVCSYLKNVPLHK